MDKSVRMALMVVLETTTPAERVAFVLHDALATPSPRSARSWNGDRRHAPDCDGRLLAKHQPCWTRYEIPPTVLHPVRFMENYLMTGTPVDGITGGLHRHMFRGDQPTPMVAVDDIAAFAVLAFGHPERFDGSVLELAGDARPSRQTIAAATGMDVGYERIAPSEADALGDEISRTRRLYETGLNWKADVAALRAIQPGPLTLDAWLQQGGAEAIKRAAGNRSR